jgi:hypothetical protein
MKTARILMGIVVVELCLAGPVFGYGAATHTYMAHRLGSEFGLMDLEEMYGAVLPDMFNLLFDQPYQGYLWTETHYEFMKLVDLGRFGRRKALAFGFASHNEEWGADQGHLGYIAEKQEALASMVEDYVVVFLMASGLGWEEAEAVGAEVLPVVAESAVESAIDLLIAQNEDPQVGARMLAAAGARGPFVPWLLCRAYAQDFAEREGMNRLEASGIIVETERQFREYMLLYGSILCQGDALEAMAEQGAEVAERLLAGRYGYDIDVPPAVTAYLLEEAMRLVEGDYAEEVQSTIARVEGELSDHGIETAGSTTWIWGRMGPGR